MFDFILFCWLCVNFVCFSIFSVVVGFSFMVFVSHVGVQIFSQTMVPHFSVCDRDYNFLIDLWVYLYI